MCVAVGDEHVAALEQQALGLGEVPGEVQLLREILLEIDPREIGRVWNREHRLREAAPQTLLQVGEVHIEIFAKALSPGVAICEHADRGGHADRVVQDERVLMPDLAEFGVGDDHEREAHPSQVEGLARRHRGDDSIVVGKQLRQRLVGQPDPQQIAMNLIGDDQDVVRFAQFNKASEFLNGETTPGRIVWVTR